MSMPGQRRLRYQRGLRRLGSASAGWDVRAVLTGLAVDLGGAMASAFLIVLTAATALAFQGLSHVQIVEDLTASSALVVFHALACILMRVAGGYAAASMAGFDRIRHAAATGVLSALALVLGSLLFEPGAPAWLRLVSPLTVIPFAMLGGYLASPSADTSLSPEKTTA